ncbi:MAG: SDR family oxidoreductase [Aphanocapsa sp. GSE-SYN-MK-11-07L]|jgi:serine 3-dehydrogenase|nr:SDR family oxidoreductase [Aphanocapsa sp. GSE-SYN-MK-11-07L]
MIDRLVLITGASSGIGLACAQTFAQAGARLILAARRSDRLQALAADLKAKFGTATHVLKLDVCDRSAVEACLQSLPSDWSGVDVLVNNAGLSRGLDRFQTAEVQDWEEMIDTNVKGLLYVTRTLLPGMIERGQGHIINIGSIAGHQTYPKGNVYCATKAAVRAITEGLKLDLLGTPIRVSTVDPGLVETEFSQVRFHGDAERAQSVYAGLTPLTPADVADVVLFCATRPVHVNINEVVLMPTDQASATQVNRQNLS